MKKKAVKKALVHRALTLWQPWASAIAHGGKDVENRPWRCPKQHIGTRIAIHAGLTYDAVGWITVRERWPGMLTTDRPRGVIVAVATVAYCTHIQDARTWSHLSEWAEGTWCWFLEDIEALDTPIPCRGNRSLWSLDPETFEALNGIALDRSAPTPKNAR